MLRLILALLAPAAFCAAAEPAGLQLVQPSVSDVDGGPPAGANFTYRPGQPVYFSCRVSGYTEDKEHQVRLDYTVQAFDAHGAPVVETIGNHLDAEITPQDKEWLPKVEASISLPTVLFSGAYKIVVKVNDLVVKTSADLTVPFTVRSADDVQPSNTLTVSAFRFLHNEDDTHPAERAAYRPGDHLWARFCIVGFRSGANKKTKVTYVTSIIGSDGKTLWSHSQPAEDPEDSFYPKPYIEAEMGIEIQPNIKPGSYQLMVQATDAVGKQTFETKQPFTIE